jgi:hypothetical protein
MPVAHFNIARLIAPPGDARVAEFVDATARVNAIAARSPGYLWHLADPADLVAGPDYAGRLGDPCLAYSLSVWSDIGDLRAFVHQTVHGAFLRRRTEWFQPWDGPNYVIWPVAPGATWPTLRDGQDRLARRAARGDGPEHHGFGGWDAAAG